MTEDEDEFFSKEGQRVRKESSLTGIFLSAGLKIMDEQGPVALHPSFLPVKVWILSSSAKGKPATL